MMNDMMMKEEEECGSECHNDFWYLPYDYQAT